MTASAGVAVTYGAVQVLGSLSSSLVLIGVAFFLALGLKPAASWFVNRKLPRLAATTLVFVIFLAVMGAFVAAAIPPLAQQASELIRVTEPDPRFATVLIGAGRRRVDRRSG